MPRATFHCWLWIQPRYNREMILAPFIDRASFGSMRWQWQLGLGLAMITCGGCLLSSPVHEAPMVSPISGPTSVSRDSDAVFSIETQAPKIEWGWRTGVCPEDLTSQEHSALGQVQLLNSRLFKLAPKQLGALCLWSLVSDGKGAQSLVWKDVLVQNVAPVAMLSAITNRSTNNAQYDLYTQLRISGSASRDPDGDAVQKFSWSITTDQGSLVAQTLCPAPTDTSELCFFPVGPGKYTVGLIVTDSIGASSPQSSLELLVAADRAPCLRDTEQLATGVSTLLRRWDEAVAFAVAVDDDGDPFPPRENQTSKVAFTWFFRKLVPGSESEFLPLTNYSQPTFRIPGQAFVQGDEVQVRVEVTDRSSTAVACPVNSDLCEQIMASGCSQRLTWKVRYWL
jgi:hypothetical protein